MTGESGSHVPGKRMPTAVGPAPLFSAKDAAICVGLPVLALISWLTPERAWRPIGRLFAPLAAGFVGGRRHNVARIRRLAAGRTLAVPPAMVAREAVAANVEENLQLLRTYRPGGWRPEIRLLGREHVDAGLARGHGVILWVGFFAYYSLITKIAFDRAGYRVSHLSHPRHGFSGTRFGIRVLNPIRNAVEDRHLEERVFLSLDGPVAAMRTLQRRLKANGAVSITAREMAQRPVAVPFMAGEIPLAGGAPDLAHLTEAALLPVFTVRQADGTFAVTVEPALEGAAGLDRREFTRRAIRRYAEILERYVLRYPGQWRGWHHL